MLLPDDFLDQVGWDNTWSIDRGYTMHVVDGELRVVFPCVVLRFKDRTYSAHGECLVHEYRLAAAGHEHALKAVLLWREYAPEVYRIAKGEVSWM